MKSWLNYDLLFIEGCHVRFRREQSRRTYLYCTTEKEFVSEIYINCEDKLKKIKIKGNAAERQRSKYVNEYFPKSQSLINTYLRIGLSQLNAISYMPSKTMGRCPMCSLALWKRAEDLKPSGLPHPTRGATTCKIVGLIY